MNKFTLHLVNCVGTPSTHIDQPVITVPGMGNMISLDEIMSVCKETHDPTTARITIF